MREAGPGIWTGTNSQLTANHAKHAKGIEGRGPPGWAGADVVKEQEIGREKVHHVLRGARGSKGAGMGSPEMKSP